MLCEKVRRFYSDPNNSGWIVVVAIIIILLTVVLATAKTSGEKPTMLGPDESEYFATLMMPDVANVSCCGEADVYWADKTEVGPDGQVIAIITDPRPNDRTLPDGREIHRQPIPIGTKIPVPTSKIRKKPIPNPTGHTIIFLGESGIVYCYEPQPLI
jgi:hypothetical protein